MIFTNVVIGALMTASLIIQAHSSFDALRIAGVKPDLLFITIVYCSYSFGSFHGTITGFIGGLLHDAVSNAPLGLLTFPKVVLGFIVGFFGRTVFRPNIVTIALLIFASSFLKGVLTLFLGYVFHEASVSQVISIIFPESFYNALLAPLLFYLFDKIFEKELSREDR
ncbi:MAG TPA: rod shape-determining protein MreD [Spirochaetes bacterium]|nr:rod shape-determining protein MreD [Spirochaetota bacterium]